MERRYKPYPEYEDSGGNSWFDCVPAHWQIKRISYVALLKSGDTIASEQIEIEGDYPVYGGNGLRGYTANFNCDGNYILIGRQGALCGNINYGHGKFWASEHAVVVHPLIHLDFRWLGETLRAMNLNQYNVSAAQPGLAITNITCLKIPFPSFEEQKKIANFLDHETSKIDILIEKQRHLIQLLKEKREAVISHVVTKGLNPHAKMRDSGIEWLGKVPEHWKILSLGKITLSKCDGPFGSGLKSEHYSEYGIRVIRLQNIKREGYYEGEGAFIDETYYKNNLSNHDVIGGDVLIAGLGDPNNPVGRACVAPADITPAMVKADCFRFRLDGKKVLPTFVARQLSHSAWSDAGRLSNGSTRARIPLSLMATRVVAICPLNEQAKIIEHIDALSEKYNKLEQHAIDASSLLAERRTALISAAVTGKIDVRNWAALQIGQTNREVAA